MSFPFLPARWGWLKFSPRSLLATLVSLSHWLPAAFGAPTADTALGVLTRAYEVPLNSMPAFAFAGLSVFEGK